MSTNAPTDPIPVIVIDLQTAMFSGRTSPPIRDADSLIERVRAVIDWARTGGHAVAFIRHDGPNGDELAPGEPGWALWHALGRADDEPIFSKTIGNAFSQPALVDWVAKLGACDVILLGAQTDKCVAATVRGARELGLGVTVVGDAHGTWDANGKTAPEIIAEHNVLFAQSGARVVDTATLTRSASPV
jgi:nicotinamidase-related amidase